MTRLTGAFSLACIAFILSHQNASAQGSRKILKTGMPEEFLDLTDQTKTEHGKPRIVREDELYVDFYVDGVRRGDTLIALRGGEVAFDSPEDTAGLIDDLRNREHFVQSLSAPFSVVTGDACIMGAGDPCEPPDGGKLGVVLDPDALRLDLFRPQRYRARPPPLAPSHPDHLGLIAGLSVRVSGVAQDGESAANGSLSFDVIGGRGRNSAFGAGSINNTGDVSIFRAGVQSFKGRHRIAGGLFRSDPSDLFPQFDVIGGEFHTTDLTRAAPSGGKDTPILLFLERSANVDIFRAGQLIFSSRAEAGPYRLPTRSFPSGSYNIVIRIRDDAGGEREERRFFSRAGGNFSTGRWEYVLQGGVTRDRSNGQFVDERGGLAFASARIGRAISPFAALSGRVGLFDDTSFFEPSINAQIGDMSLRASGMATHKGGYGASAQVSGSWLGVNLSGRALYTDFDDPRLSRRSIDGGPYTEFNINASTQVPWLGGQVSGIGRIVDTPEKPTRTSYGAAWNRSVKLPWPNVSANLSLGFQHTARDNRVLFTLRLWRRAAGSVMSASVGSRITRSGPTRGEEFKQQARWIRRSTQRSLSPWSAGLRMSNATDADWQIGGFGQIQNDKFTGDLQIDYTGGDQARVNYFGSLSGSIAVTGDGLATSGVRNAKAGVLLNMKNEPDDAQVNAVIGGRKVSKVGGLTFVPISEFQLQKVRLRTVAGGAADYDQNAIEVSAFPGNVVRFSPSLLRKITIFGRVVDNNAKGVSGAFIRIGDDLSRVDENGYFVLDAPIALASLEFEVIENQRCVFELPGFTEYANAAFIDLGDIPCDAPASASPNAKQ